MTEKLIILDRDGVINYDSIHYIKSPDEWIPIPGSLEAIARLNAAGYKIAVATNQSVIGRGLTTLETLEQIHTKMQTLLRAVHGHVDAIFFCPHTDQDRCNCRKPKIGLYEQIKMHFDTDLHNVPAIGDSLRDLQAAELAGAKPMLVKTGNGLLTLAANPALEHIPVFDDLRDAVANLV